MKRPAFQFYPADWRKDTALQFCSLAAQGLWINALCIAHECEPYGHLVLNGKPMTSAQIGRLVGLSAKESDKLLAELVDAGVCSKTEEGAFFSRRMVRDEDLRNRRASGGQAGAEHGTKGASHGSKGGRPKADEGGINNPPSDGSRGDKEPPSEPPIKPPPSSSSSSSTSVEEQSKLSLASAFPPEKAPLALVPDSGQPKAKTVPDCPHLAVLALWAEALPALPQHTPSLWRGARADHLRARWRETASLKGWATEADGLAYLRKLFGFVGQSTFLTGRARSQDGRPPFVAELAWLVKPENWAKTIEGKYHQEAA